MRDFISITKALSDENRVRILMIGPLGEVPALISLVNVALYFQRRFFKGM